MPTARNITRTGTLIQAATRLRKKLTGFTGCWLTEEILWEQALTMLASLLEVAPIRINTATMVRETDKLNASFSINKVQNIRLTERKESGEFQQRAGAGSAGAGLCIPGKTIAG